MAAGLQRGRGLASDAHVTALRALGGAVARQGTVLAFEKTFLLQGAAFLAVLPLLFFLRVRGSAAPSEPVEFSME